ncbi:MAG: lipoate--protein ligase [Ruminococcaceae bacterium]|nr:lipoate--protein ligase [Oscillospiraceae bacterium]
MLYIESPVTDPHWNLALEEHLFSGKSEEVFMLWQNSSSIIIGKNQNAMAEIDYSYVTKENIPVVRRLTGGGAVYHDLGNLNFTYIVNREGFGDYIGFTKTLREYLASLGLSAEVSGRNDVLVDGKKISGNAQYSKQGRLLHHGTILIGADMTHLSRALRPDEEKIKSKGIRSVQSRVTNLGPLLSMDVEVFRAGFAAFVSKSEDMQPYILSAEDRAAVDKLVKEKYGTFAWNYGYSPKYAFHTRQRFPGGGVEVFLDIRDGIIRDAKIFGDFLGDAVPLAEGLRGLAHNAETLRKAVKKFPFGTISEEELLSCFL